MKRTILSTLIIIITAGFAKAQLTIYSGLQNQGTSATCVPSTIYVGNNIPNGLNNNIKSIKLQQGYMATIAANEDGSGFGFNYVAVTSDISVDLFYKLQDSVSFIRVLPITDVKKKGAGTKDNDRADLLQASWLYDWGANDVSVPNREYVPMAWGRGGATNPINVDGYISKPNVTCLLGFNEPDNSDQSNIAYEVAVPAYKNLLRTGLRLGSPATEEQNYAADKWLGSFMNGVDADTTRVDFIAVHWYDWGNWGPNQNVSADPTQMFNRFKNYINAVYNIYKKPIWITEFNANRNRDAATQIGFMQLALPYLESDPRVERYAYFFPPTHPPVENGLLTSVGQTYSDHVSTSSFATNIIDTRPTSAPSENNEKVFNGDFEITSATAPIFPGWTLSAGADFVVESGANSINGKSARFASAGNNRFMTSDAIEVTPGQTYRLQFTARIQSATGLSGSPAPTRGGVFSGTILNGLDSNPTTFTALTTTSSTNVTLSGNYTIPAGQNSIRLRFRKTADIAYLDDVSLLNASVLPIELKSFTGKAQNNGIDLNWTTISERNNEKFTIYNSNDGKNFNKIVSIDGAGDSNELKNYSFLDRNPFNGVNYYKLSQTDYDGKTEDFEPIAVEFALQASDNTVKVYGDQNSTQLEINWSIKEAVSVHIYDLNGRKLLDEIVELDNGLNTVKFNTTGKLSSNHLYLLRVKGSQQDNVVKFYSDNK